MLSFRLSAIMPAPSCALDSRVWWVLAVVKLVVGLGHFLDGGEEEAEKEKFCEIAFAKLPAPVKKPPVALSSCQNLVVGEGLSWEKELCLRSCWAFGMRREGGVLPVENGCL